MEVGSAKGVFGNCGAQAQCRCLQRKTGSEALRGLRSGAWTATGALGDRFYNRLGKFRTQIPAAKVMGRSGNF